MTTCLPFWDWIEQEAALIKTDGCSKVSGAYRKRCRVHDLSYFYGRDPVDAYKRYAAGDPEYWFNAHAITRATADADFRRGIQADSALGFFSPVAAWRWIGVRLGGKGAWEDHRAAERQET